MKTSDFLVIGAGVIGLSIARELQRRYSDRTVTVIEKEAEVGQHASGRNSGVLHSGIYYSSDSLKARFTRDGNLAWQHYCDERNFQVDRCGKLVVSTSESDLVGLNTLLERGELNNVEVQRLDAKEVKHLEPRVRTNYPALFVPSTATINPKQLVSAITSDFHNAGGILHMHCKYLGNMGDNAVNTSVGKFSAGYIVNCAGLYADHVAHDYGFGERYTVLPFKGLYLYAHQDSISPRVHIYPVPDLRNPFLGVHFTRTTDGDTKIGPTAIPGLWREHYSGLQNFSLRELLQISGRELQMLATNRNGFRELAWKAMSKQNKWQIVREAERLMSGVEAMQFDRWGNPGIRAQLFDRHEQKLEMDFVVEGDDRSLHVLNAVSPAFTCALPFASYVVDQIETKE